MKKQIRKYELEGQTSMVVNDIILLITGIGVSVLILIFIGVLGGATYNIVEPDIDALGGSQGNVTGLALNGTEISLGQTSIHGDSLVIRNNTGDLYSHANYTVDFEGGTWELWGNTTSENGTVFFSYDFGNTNITNAIKGSIVSSFTALETTGDFLPIIVLAVIIAIVLSLVLGFTQLGGGALGGGSRGAL